MKKFLFIVVVAASLLIFGGQADAEGSTVDRLNSQNVQLQEAGWSSDRERRERKRRERERRARERRERERREWERRHPYPPPPPPPPPPMRPGHGYPPPPPPPPHRY